MNEEVQIMEQEAMVRLDVTQGDETARMFVTRDILHDAPALALVVRQLAEKVTEQEFIPRIGVG